MRRLLTPIIAAMVVVGLLPSIALAGDPQTVSFDSTAPTDAVVGGPSYEVAASATSGLTVTVTVDAASAGACSISGSTVSMLHAGTCVLDADQEGDGTWDPAPQVQQQFDIAKATQVVSFTSTAPSAAKVGGSYTPAATGGGSGNPVVFSIDAAAAGVCSLSGGDVQFDAAGTCTVDADQAGNDDYLAADQAQQSFTVSTVVVGNTPPTCTGGPASVVMNVAYSASGGCSDVDNDALTYAIVDQPAHGTASIDASGTWTYKTALDSLDADSFTIKANDGTGDSSPATVSITVTNHDLDARNDSASIKPFSGVVVNVLKNDFPGVGGTDTGQPLRITAVTQGKLGTVTNNGTSVTYDPNGCAAGSDTFTYTVTDGQYTSPAKTVFMTIYRPGQGGLSTSPLTDTPGVQFVTNSTIGSTIPTKVAWCGVTASGSSVRSYRLIQNINGSSYVTLISATTAKSSVRSLLTNRDYRWKVRTVDSAGRTGAYKGTQSIRLTKYENTSASITYSGAWVTHTTTSASGGSERYASRADASASLIVSNIRSFAIVGPMSSTRGSFTVYVDDVPVRTVSEKASTLSYRRVLYVRSVTGGTHTIKIMPVGGARIDLDAILTLRTP